MEEERIVHDVSMFFVGSFEGGKFDKGNILQLMTQRFYPLGFYVEEPDIEEQKYLCLFLDHNEPIVKNRGINLGMIKQFFSGLMIGLGQKADDGAVDKVGTTKKEV